MADAAVGGLTATGSANEIGTARYCEQTRERPVGGPACRQTAAARSGHCGPRSHTELNPISDRPFYLVPVGRSSRRSLDITGGIR